MKLKKEKAEDIAYAIFVGYTMFSWAFTAINIIVLIIKTFAK